MYIVGRSNTGKSTLINAILGRRDLVKTSKKPVCSCPLPGYCTLIYCDANFERDIHAPSISFVSVDHRETLSSSTHLGTALVGEESGVSLSIDTF